MTEADKAQAQLAGDAASGGRLGQLVLDLWQRTRIDWGFASDRLADSFRRERKLRSDERRFAAETLYGMIRHWRVDELWPGRASPRRCGPIASACCLPGVEGGLGGEVRGGMRR